MSPEQIKDSGVALKLGKEAYRRSVGMAKTQPCPYAKKDWRASFWRKGWDIEQNRLYRMSDSQFEAVFLDLMMAYC